MGKSTASCRAGAHIGGEELRSAWTLRLRSGQAREGARPHTSPSPHEPVPTRSMPAQRLLLNYAAGDAVAGVARGVGLLVVGLRVDHKRCSAVAEQRMAVFAERHVFILCFEMRFAIRPHGEVGVVASMVALGILQSMLLAIGIEVGSRGLEVRGIALRVLMKVDGMNSGR